MATTPPRVSIEDSDGSRGSENNGGEEVLRKEGSEISPEILKENRGVVKVWSADDGGPNVGGRTTSEAEASMSLSEYRIVNDKEELIPRKMSLALEAEKEKNSYAEVVNEGSTPGLVPEFTVVDGVADIKILVEVFEDVAPLWKSCVVGYFMGDSPFIGSIYYTVNRIWGSPKTKVDVQFISKRTLGKSESEASVKGKEVVLKLLDDLEKVEVISRSALVATEDSQSHVEAGSSGLFVSQKEGDWSLNGRSASPRRLSQTMPVGGVESPNGFQRRGGIVDEEEDEEETAMQEEDEDRVHDPSLRKDQEGAVGARLGTAQASTMQLPGHKTRGKGRRGKQPEEIMSSIFAWNMHGFNTPCKQRAVRHWLQAARLNFGCLLENRVQKENFQTVFDATFPGWSCLHNYDYHHLGRIWVCWMNEVEIVPASMSSQMITCWVRIKSTGEIMLASFVYAFNQANERTVLWREMEDVAPTTMGNMYPWIVQGDFNQGWNATAPLYHSRLALKLFHSKLKSIKSSLRKLNRDMLLASPSPEAFEEVSAAWKYWHHISGIEEQFYFQKSRVQWMELEDRNNCFYHKVCQAQCSKNAIRRIITEDRRILTDLQEIKVDAAQHFDTFLNGQSSTYEGTSREYLQ
ncbi:hypothetical protein HID58_068142, partial [Brassica napus]